MTDEARPFLRWVGGKARIVDRLRPFVPPLGAESRYFEPFLGAGSLYFRLRPKLASLSDLNGDLMDCYQRVADRPDLVWRHLRPLMGRQAPEDYYSLREEFNRTEPSTRRAALFIYLNRTSFNGIWRVSGAGRYNVPYGGKLRPGFPDARHLRVCANTLSSAQLVRGDFESALKTANLGDFAYLDPPYLPINSTSFFHHYTLDRFGPADHERLADVASDMASNGVLVMITEGDSALVRKWYRDFFIREITVRRFVTPKAHKQLVQELVITSYRPRSDH